LALECNTQRPKREKKEQHGWYEVESIADHRIESQKGLRPQIALGIKWKGYDELTWEKFDPFVKDAPALVESYLLKNILLPYKKLLDTSNNLN